MGRGGAVARRAPLGGTRARGARRLGRDTRESGAWIERAFIEGARAAGASCESAGVITTPGVAFLTRTLPADAGVVISASHNPFYDNGIKIFSPTGRKLDDATERLIEADIHAGRSKNESAALTNDEDESALATEAEESAHETDEAPAEAALRRLYLDYLSGEVQRTAPRRYESGG